MSGRVAVPPTLLQRARGEELRPVTLTREQARWALVGLGSVLRALNGNGAGNALDAYTRIAVAWPEVETEARGERFTATDEG